MAKVLITTVPFGEINHAPFNQLKEADCEVDVNPLGRRLKEEELRKMIAPGYDVLIAGTEPITAAVMDAVPSLKLIARVGVGLDNVDLEAARQRKIAVSYTPDAPALAVAELTIGLMLALLRFIPQADRAIRTGQWTRLLGRRLADCTVGVIGVGRIGTLVIRYLQGFSPREIIVNDHKQSVPVWMPPVRWVEKETIYREADIITLHLPLTKETKNLIGEKELAMMKPNAILINTSRGSIIEEHALDEALVYRPQMAAGLDVFTYEPYAGWLATRPNCLLTCHMGSMTYDCRARMEREAVEDVLRFLRGVPLRYDALLQG